MSRWAGDRTNQTQTQTQKRGGKSTGCGMDRVGVRSDMHGIAPPRWLLDSGQGQLTTWETERAGAGWDQSPLIYLPRQGMPLAGIPYFVYILSSSFRPRLQAQYFSPWAAAAASRGKPRGKSVMMPPFPSSVQCPSSLAPAQRSKKGKEGERKRNGQVTTEVCVPLLTP
ncbi:hypothetical protein LZ30DRAFT_50581 [Colletotrichum cereale]|nr:hypothetical protein LZ30DRAFT_50581 [Colletotrichum cereale]